MSRSTGFRKRYFLLLLSLLLATSWAVGANFAQLVYVGTYTEKDSKGIYFFRFDPVSGESGPVELAVETPNPSFLAVDSGAKHVYAVNEVGEFQGSKTGAVSVFAVDRAAGKLRLLQQVPSGGADPAHISLDRSGRFVLVANYTGGNIAVFPVESDGQLGKRTAFIQNTGSSVNKERQSSPHAHEILTTSDNHLVLVPDLGTDKLMEYRFDVATGQLTPNKPEYATISPGSGPRHFAIAPSGKFLYLVNELTSTVDVFSFDFTTGSLHQVQSISTLPADFKGESTTAEIAVGPTGKVLYVSNRGDDSIAVFAIDPKSGKLTFAQRMPTGGKEPRHFTLDPTGKWLFAANQNSDTINLFTVDGATGRLTPTSYVIHVPVPVCVVPVSAK